MRFNSEPTCRVGTDALSLLDSQFVLTSCTQAIPDHPPSCVLTIPYQAKKPPGPAQSRAWVVVNQRVRTELRLPAASWRAPAAASERAPGQAD